MREFTENPGWFDEIVADLLATTLRSEVQVEQVPGPAKSATHTFAIEAEVPGTADGDELASGRFVLLYEPQGRADWGGTMRVVAFARAEQDQAHANDPMLGDVGWSWLVDALDAAGAKATNLGGTVTRVLSESHGELCDRPPVADLEVRASWCPSDEQVPAHLQAWSQLLCLVAGLPPVEGGATKLFNPR